MIKVSYAGWAGRQFGWAIIAWRGTRGIKILLGPFVVILW